jgi:radical SAM protein with 4Fe4S-binding SPASM domain
MREEMFFYTDGRAVLCCWDIAGRAVIGDVNESSVLEIWNGEHRRRYAEYLARGEREKILLCSRCDAYAGRHFEGFDD